MNLQTITAPAYWASALVNGDYSSLDVSEASHLRAWMKDNCVVSVLSLAGDDQESRFTKHYRLYDPLAECSGGDVLDYVCDVDESDPDTASQ